MMSKIELQTMLSVSEMPLYDSIEEAISDLGFPNVVIIAHSAFGVAIEGNLLTQYSTWCENNCNKEFLYFHVKGTLGPGPWGNVTTRIYVTFELKEDLEFFKQYLFLNKLTNN